MKRLWKLFCNLLRWPLWAEGEHALPGDPYEIPAYRGYAIDITKDPSGWTPIRCGAIAINTDWPRAIIDGGSCEGPRLIEVSGWESPGQAAEAMRMEINAVLPRVTER